MIYIYTTQNLHKLYALMFEECSPRYLMVFYFNFFKCQYFLCYITRILGLLDCFRILIIIVNRINVIESYFITSIHGGGLWEQEN